MADAQCESPGCRSKAKYEIRAHRLDPRYTYRDESGRARVERVAAYMGERVEYVFMVCGRHARNYGVEGGEFRDGESVADLATNEIVRSTIARRASRVEHRPFWAEAE